MNNTSLFRYFEDIFRDILDWNELTENEKASILSENPDAKPITAGTLGIRLGMLTAFFKFLKEKYIYAGLTHQDIEAVNLNIERMRAQCSVSTVLHRSKLGCRVILRYGGAV